MAEGISPNITVDPCPQGSWAKLRKIAAGYYSVKNLLFCDRIVFIEAYERLINSNDDATGLKILAVEAPPTEKPPQGERPQYGKSRLLRVLAARAVHDGHILCLLDQPEVPSTSSDLGRELIDAINAAYERFELPKPLNQDQTLAYEFLLLKDAGLDPARAARLSTLTRQALQIQNNVDHPAVIAEALCADMRTLVSTARQQYPGAKLLLLVDDVHRFGVDPANRGALELFLRSLLTPGYLLRPGDPIRVIFTYSKATEAEYGTAVKSLKEFVQGTSAILCPLSLEAFRGPEASQRDKCLQDEYHLAYQQFLLHNNLVIRDDIKPEERENIYRRLHSAIRGIPSLMRLSNDLLQWALDIYNDHQLLVPADDDAVLEKQKELRQ